MARDLHDQIGQILTAIKLDLTWMNRQLPKANERATGTAAQHHRTAQRGGAIGTQDLQRIAARRSGRPGIGGGDRMAGQ